MLLPSPAKKTTAKRWVKAIHVIRINGGRTKTRNWDPLIKSGNQWAFGDVTDLERSPTGKNRSN